MATVFLIDVDNTLLDNDRAKADVALAIGDARRSGPRRALLVAVREGP